MRYAISAILLTALLAATAQAVIHIRLTADSTDLSPGQTTVVRIWAQGTESGIFSLGGNITATGPALLTAKAGTFAWVSAFRPTEMLLPKVGEPGDNGGWTGFGSAQTEWIEPDSSYGKTDHVEVASYTVTAGSGSGVVSLSFDSGNASGFKPLEVGKGGTIGTVTGVSIHVGDATTPSLAGDFDLDGLVSILDVLRLARAYGSNQGDPEFDAACDLDSDETIGIGDLLMLVENFGKMR